MVVTGHSNGEKGVWHHFCSFYFFSQKNTRAMSPCIFGRRGHHEKDPEEHRPTQHGTGWIHEDEQEAPVAVVQRRPLVHQELLRAELAPVRHVRRPEEKEGGVMSVMSKTAKILGGFISKNSPSILTGMSVAGLITTAVLAVRATPKALILLEEEYERRQVDDHRQGLSEDVRDRVGNALSLSARDVVVTTWKCYIPATAVGLATIGCIIGANSIHLRRTAALAGLYSVTETAFKEYQAKVVETIGQNKERSVRDDIAADTIKANPPATSEIIITGKGEALCLDTLSGRYFKSDIESIRRVINQLNGVLLREMFVPLNDLYYELGLSMVKLGNEIGWDVEKGLIEAKFSSQLAEDGTPCLVIDYQVYPKFRN